MKTRKLTTQFFGYKVQVSLNLPDEYEKNYTSVPFSVSDNFSEQIECGVLEGSFENLPDDELSSIGQGYILSGSWHVIVFDYEKICRVLSWEYNFSQTENLNEEIFVRYFGGVMGRHYYNKWKDVYRYNLHDMLVYFGGSCSEGQLFCDMLAEQIFKYEQRKSASKDEKK